ncbi:MAG: bifunctional folylpolyglutamate synthase/dihydrofolate synthase [Gammaproteobacteria bacterium]|nr:bifunctional folylpolyglutamate synthase/dihydrofolate synthase [Gammaproteobacteria bacterium]MDH4254234.1 bifunctional folylpolyglutamate synthase/dihydrofolate synthase [Gammaproteobacteria bacterium]MDH5311396.1 bifunctional folylpolyglutamate synthase/dihydrofolate synthase [Gammaproteobacteria bacterium]
MTAPGSSSTLDQWLRWLETLAPNEIDLGLERVAEVLGRMRLPPLGTVITVAGTNGKGSSVAMLEALFIAAGRRVGAYTSPHLVHYAERIRVDGAAVADAGIIAAFRRVESVREGVALTYFEYGTLAALQVFAESGAEVLVLEVGLGGRLDAVNVVDADACLITNIGLDHCDWLGPDVESIAAEKAGVMRPGRPVVFGSAEPPNAIRATAERLGAELVVAGRDFNSELEGDGRWSWLGRRIRLAGLEPPALGGPHQVRNAAAVLALIEAMGFDAMLERGLIDSAFARLRLDGRMQRVSAWDRHWLLDVAHNPDGASVLAEALRSRKPAGRLLAVTGILADKDAGAMIDALGPVVDAWIACTPASGRALEGRELASLIANRTGKPCLVGMDPVDALLRARQRAGPDDLVLVAGSFYTVGPALAALTRA